MDDTRPGAGKVILAVLCLSAVYLATRLPLLTGLPFFTDEATYLGWAREGLDNPALRYMSLADGKQPLFIWLAMVAMKLVADPLMAGRLVSVVVGFVGMWGCACFAGVLLRDRRAGLWAALLYVISPMVLFYDRLAIYESLTVCIVAWSLALIVWFTRTVRLDAALLLGLVIAAGLLTKSSTAFAVPFLLMSVVLFGRENFRAKKFFGWCGGILIVVVLAAAAGVGPLLLTPWFEQLIQKNRSFVYPISDWIKAPTYLVKDNLKLLGPWLLGYMTVPFALLAAVGFLWGRSHGRARLFLLLAAVLPFAYLAFLGKLLYPRYLLFVTLPLLVLGARVLLELRRWIPNTVVRTVVLLAIAAYPVYFDAMIVAKPEKAPLVDRDRFQHLDDWPAGVGFFELRDRFREAAKERPIYVATEGQFGLFPSGLQVYFHGDTRVEVAGLAGLPPESVTATLRKRAADRPCYVVFWEGKRSAAAVELQKSLVQEWEHRRPAEDSVLRLYRLRDE